MLSSVLNSDRAIEANIAIMRAFVRSRGVAELSREVKEKLHELEGRVVIHDEDIKSIFAAIRRLTDPPATPKRRIGFDT